MIPVDVQLQFSKAIRLAKSGVLNEDFILPAYWIQIEQWNEDCLDEGPKDTLKKAFDRYIADHRETNGFEPIKTVWVDNGETVYGSSVTLFRKTRKA